MKITVDELAERLVRIHAHPNLSEKHRANIAGWTDNDCAALHSASPEEQNDLIRSLRGAGVCGLGDTNPQPATDRAAAGHSASPEGVPEQQTTFQIAAAPRVNTASENRVLTLKTLAEKIRALPAIEDKTDGLIIYPGRFEEGVQTRTLGNIQACTSAAFDFDGRNKPNGDPGDRVRREDFEDVCREAGVEVITWLTHSAPDDLTGCTFRALLPYKAELPVDLHRPALAAIGKMLGMAPQLILHAAQGFFCQPRPGVEHDVRVLPGKPIDTLLDLHSLNPEGEPAKKVADTVDVFPLTEQQIADAIVVIDALRAKGLHKVTGTGIWHRVVGALALYGEQGEGLALRFSEGGCKTWKKDTLEKLKQKRRKGAMPIGNLFSIAAEFGIENPGAGRRQVAEFPLDDVPEDVPEGINDLPFDIDWPPGFVGEIAKHIHETSLTRIRSFSIAAGLFAVSLMAANRFYVRRTDTSLNLYMVLSGKTGEGKEAPRKALNRMLKHSPFISCIWEKAASATGLLRAMEARHPRVFASMTDEYGLLLQGYSGVKANPNNQLLMALILNLFGSARSTFSPTAYANRRDNIQPIDNPYFLLFGTTTPAMLLAAYTPDLIAAGMVNRILVVSAAGHEPENTNLDFSVPENIKARIAEFAARLVFIDDEDFDPFDHDRMDSVLAPDTGLEFEAGGFELLNELAKVPDNEGTPEELWGRYREHVIRVAGVLAVGDGGVIKAGHVRWAHSFVDWCHRSFARKVVQQVGEGQFAKLTAKALDAIANPKHFASDRQFSQLCKKGLMPSGKLSKVLKIPKGDKAKVIEYLLETEQIKQGEKDGHEVFWCPKVS